MWAIDANFKLKQKNHGYEDIERADGWAYFVPSEEYLKFVQGFVDEVEVSRLA